MTYEELTAMLKEVNLPFAYDHFAEGESPDPPFYVFLIPSVETFGADNIVYASFPEVNVELYTDKKSPKLEKRLEKIFNSHEVYWQKSETWIASERMYEVLYELTL